MKYLNQTFSVAAGESSSYRDNWDRIFGRKGIMFKRVENKDRKFGSATEYYHAETSVAGEKVDLLFTAEELAAAANRAAANPEDYMKYDPADEDLLTALASLVNL